MTAYMTDDEKIDLIKKWWNDYGSMILIALSIIMLSIIGYRYWTLQTEKKVLESSVLYEQMMLGFTSNNSKQIESYARKLTRDFEKTVYSDVAHLALASVYVKENKLKLAKSELNQLISSSNRAQYKQLAQIRLARIEMAMKDYKNALNTLNASKFDIYMPLANELKGDIYAQTGDYKKAADAYQTALNSKHLNEGSHLYLEMKINETAVKAEKLQA